MCLIELLLSLVTVKSAKSTETCWEAFAQKINPFVAAKARLLIMRFSLDHCVHSIYANSLELATENNAYSFRGKIQMPLLYYFNGINAQVLPRVTRLV